MTDMGLDTLESFWLKHTVQFGVVGLFVSNFLIDRGLTPCTLAERDGSWVVNSDGFWGLEIFLGLCSPHLERAEDFLYKAFGKICPGQPVKQMFQLLTDEPNVYVKCLATYSICGYMSDCVCVCSVAQSCSTFCDAMDCPWDSPGKNTGVGCLSLLQYVRLPIA